MDTAQPDPYMTESMTINQPLERVYEAWLDLASLAFMRDAEITESRDQEMCSWCSPDGSVGWVRFERAPGARGTEVHVEVRQKSRPLEQHVVRALGMAPDQQIREDLRRFKQWLETGEITTSDAPGLWRPAQPRRVRNNRRPSLRECHDACNLLDGYKVGRSAAGTGSQDSESA